MKSPFTVRGVKAQLEGRILMGCKVQADCVWAGTLGVAQNEPHHFASTNGAPHMHLPGLEKGGVGVAVGTHSASHLF